MLRVLRHKLGRCLPALVPFVMVATLFLGYSHVRSAYERLMESRLMREVERSALMRNTTEPRRRYEFILEPKVIVSEYRNMLFPGRWTSIVIVKSAISNKDRRDAIRETWASKKVHSSTRLYTFFLVGQPNENDLRSKEAITAEHAEHDDILWVDLLDVASQVPDKTLAGMQWVADSVPEDWIYSTADDDMSLHVRNFASYVDESILQHCKAERNHMQQSCRLPIMCLYSYQTKDPPSREPQSKWLMPIDRYPPAYWPPYCRGGWYSMPVGLARRLYEISRWMGFLHLDDVWITGLMRLKYATTVSKHKDNLMRSYIDAAPLSLRSERELNYNLGESPNDVIVSHAWGNIDGRKVDVVEKLRSDWNRWLQDNLG